MSMTSTGDTSTDATAPPAAGTPPRRTIVGIVIAAVAIALGVGLAIGAAYAGDSGTHDAIAVHGDWTVTVNEPDGTLAAEHNFENELTSLGAEQLARLLAGDDAFNIWRLELGSSATAPCRNNDGSRSCTFLPTNFTVGEGSEGFLFNTLEWERDGGTVVLSASFVAPGDGIIERYVSSLVLDTSSQTFASKVLDEAVEVVEGQEVMISVVYSFE